MLKLPPLCALTTTPFETLQSVRVNIDIHQVYFLNFSFLLTSILLCCHRIPFPTFLSTVLPSCNMTSVPSSPKATSSFEKAPFSSSSLLTIPSFSKPFPSQRTPTPPPRDEIIALSEAFKADKALSKPSGSSFSADSNRLLLTPEVQVCIKPKNKRPNVKRKRSIGCRSKPRKQGGDSPAPSPPHQTALPPYHRYLSFEGSQQGFSTACAKITDLVLPVASLVCICTMGKRASIFMRSTQCLCDVVDSNLRYNPSILIVDMYDKWRV